MLRLKTLIASTRSNVQLLLLSYYKTYTAVREMMDKAQPPPQVMTEAEFRNYLSGLVSFVQRCSGAQIEEFSPNHLIN
jgi:hypothetical protein